MMSVAYEHGQVYVYFILKLSRISEKKFAYLKYKKMNCEIYSAWCFNKMYPIDDYAKDGGPGEV